MFDLKYHIVFLKYTYVQKPIDWKYYFARMLMLCLVLNAANTNDFLLPLTTNENYNLAICSLLVSLSC